MVWAWRENNGPLRPGGGRMTGLRGRGTGVVCPPCRPAGKASRARYLSDFLRSQVRGQLGDSRRPSSRAPPPPFLEAFLGAGHHAKHEACRLPFLSLVVQTWKLRPGSERSVTYSHTAMKRSSRYSNPGPLCLSLQRMGRCRALYSQPSSSQTLPGPRGLSCLVALTP